MGRLTAAIATCAIAAAATGCGRSAPPAGPSSFTAGGMHVTVTTTDGAVVARFAPVKPGFHLYSIHLPAGGIDGLGQRTELTVSRRLRPAGRLTAVSTLSFAACNESVCLPPVRAGG